MIHIYREKIEDTWFAAAIQDNNIIATTFAQNESDALRPLLKSLPYNMSFEMTEKSTQHSKKVLSALKSIFDGKDTSSNFELEMNHLSSYAQKVLKCVYLIPVGYVTTYGAVAKAVGGSPRAVGRIMATNPFPPLVPCHRVVRSDFTLGGFGLGIAVKWEMLQRENRNYSQNAKIKVNSKSLSLFPINLLRKE